MILQWTEVFVIILDRFVCIRKVHHLPVAQNPTVIPSIPVLRALLCEELYQPSYQERPFPYTTLVYVCVEMSLSTIGSGGHFM